MATFTTVAPPLGRPSGAAGGGPSGAVALGYVLVLAALAAWGLVPAWRRRAAATRTFDRPFAGRIEAEALGLWLLWGAVLQLRPGRDAESWLAFQVPLLLAASLGLEDLTWRASRRLPADASRLAVAVAVGLALAIGLVGVQRIGRGGGRDILPPARRLAADVAALEEREASERPIVEVVTGDRIDAVLAWYLRASRVRWAGAGGAGTDAAEPRIVLTRRALPSAELAGLPATGRYAIAASGDRVEVIELH
jgi:hypothetical protein